MSEAEGLFAKKGDGIIEALTFAGKPRIGTGAGTSIPASAQESSSSLRIWA